MVRRSTGRERGRRRVVVTRHTLAGASLLGGVCYAERPIGSKSETGNDYDDDYVSIATGSGRLVPGLVGQAVRTCPRVPGGVIPEKLATLATFRHFGSRAPGRMSDVPSILQL